MLLYFALTLQVENAGVVEMILNRVFFGAAIFGVVLFSGNYLDIHEKFVLTRSKHKWVRTLGIILIDLAIFALAVLILALLLDVLAP